jgi:hypothetical protein
MRAVLDAACEVSLTTVVWIERDQSKISLHSFREQTHTNAKRRIPFVWTYPSRIGTTFVTVSPVD